jgi:hypothetical protein
VEPPGRDAEGAETGVDGDDAVAPVTVAVALVTVGTLTVAVGLVTVGTLTVAVGVVTVGTLTIGTETVTAGTLTVGTGTLGTGSSANACAQPIASNADAPRTPRAPFTIFRSSAVWFGLPQLKSIIPGAQALKPFRPAQPAEVEAYEPDGIPGPTAPRRFAAPLLSFQDHISPLGEMGARRPFFARGQQK